MSNAPVLFDLTNGVGTVTYNRPDRHNAISDEMGELATRIVADAIDNPEVRVIVLRGAGKSFCSGRDTTQLGTRANGESDFEYVRRAQNNRLAVMDAPKPVIASVRGWAIGGGLEMALACDIRIAAPDIKLRMPEINYGLLPDTGGTQFISTLANPSRAKLMIMSGEVIGAEEALAWGLVDRIVPADELDAYVQSFAENLATKSSVGLAMAKQMIDSSWIGAAREGMRQELNAQIVMFAERDKHGAVRGEYAK
jgi:enoyl-CoA hydratase/carnithine racemase